MTTPKLRTSTSSGPRLDEYFVEGRMYMNEWSKPCCACRKDIAAGETISYLHGEWAHAACATDRLVTGAAADAWLALASDLARYPRSYKTAETRLIVNQLLRIASGRVSDGVNFEDKA